MSYNHCPFCGSAVESGNQFCSNCGAALTSVATPIKEASYIPPQQYPFSQPVYQHGTTTTYVRTTPPKQESSLGIISLIFSIINFCGLAPIGSIVAIVCGHLAKSRGSNGSATAGLIIGYIGLILFILAFFIIILPLYLL